MNSKNISDLLNRSEYIEKISAYDAGLLETFIANKTSLQEKKADLINKKKQLQLEKEELAIEEEALQEIATKKTVELEQYNTDITNAETSMNENDLELERQEQIITEALLEQQKKIAEEEKRREEEAKRLAEEAAKKNENSDGTEVVTPTKEPSTTIDTTGFGWPLSIPGTITSYFGHRTSPTAGASSYHQGIDISASTGTPIFAANAGTVVTASYSSGAGNYVMINHGGGVFTVYMHASKLAVSVNQEVKKGQTIAYVGSTGISTGPHLHFGVSVKGSYVNPLNYVSQ